MSVITSTKLDQQLFLGWSSNEEGLKFNDQSIRTCLSRLDQPFYIAETAQGFGVSNSASIGADVEKKSVVGFSPPLNAEDFGEAGFKQCHGVKYAYYAGAMANGIASEEMVIALGRAGFLASFGAAGLIPSRVEEAIQRIQQVLPDGPYMFNLIHAPKEEALERGAVELYIKYGVRTVEASAYMNLSPHIVRYRLSGLSRNADGSVHIANKVIGKVSRLEVAERFMSPAPRQIVSRLLEEGHITTEQAKLSEKVPMADDITAEADSGGHTDQRAFITLLPAIIQLRDRLQDKYEFNNKIRVGAGGGIGTSQSALAAFNLGAAFIVTGSINQSCIEANASEHTRNILAKASMTDVTMAPAADMFEMGVKLQVLRTGTLFAMRAQKLYNLYTRYDSIDDIPRDEREKIEKQIFRQSLEDIWQSTISFFQERDPSIVKHALNDEKRKMALIFRWYLGLSSRWSNIGEKGREMDYQIWAGPALGAFNEWVKGTYLEKPENRKVVDLAHHILKGAAFEQRINLLRFQGLDINIRYKF